MIFIVYAIGIDIQAWKYSTKQKTSYICEDLLAGKTELKDAVNKSPTLLMNYNRLKINLESYKIDKSQNQNTYKISKNLWIYGKPGCGKTYYATHLYEKFYMKSQTKWWDGYNDEEVVILDDYDDPSLGHYIKIWADNYSCKGEIKNGTVHLNFKVFIITSNYMPRSLWPQDKPTQYAICRRFNFISVSGEFPNFIKVDLPNPIEAPF